MNTDALSMGLFIKHFKPYVILKEYLVSYCWLMAKLWYWLVYVCMHVYMTLMKYHPTHQVSGPSI